MITILYHRFVLEPETDIEVWGFNHKVHKMTYHVEIEHFDDWINEACMDDARDKADKFLKEHYGYVIIKSTIRAKDIELSNIADFWSAMLNNNLLVIPNK